MTHAFLLTRQWRDTRDGILLDFWWATEKGACWTQVVGQEVVFFALRHQADAIKKLLGKLRHWRMAEVELKNFHNQPVNALYFKHHRTARDAQDILEQHAIPIWEYDIRPAERYLMERFVTAGAVVDIPDVSQCPVVNPRISALPEQHGDWRPSLKMLSLDIETSMDAKQLY